MSVNYGYDGKRMSYKYWKHVKQFMNQARAGMEYGEL